MNDFISREQTKKWLFLDMEVKNKKSLTKNDIAYCLERIPFAAFDSDTYIEIIKEIVWYNGLSEYIKEWRNLQKINGVIKCPINYGTKGKSGCDLYQLQILWMIAVLLFGDYCTSPRFGWIENCDDFRTWCDKIIPEEDKNDENN